MTENSTGYKDLFRLPAWFTIVSALLKLFKLFYREFERNICEHLIDLREFLDSLVDSFQADCDPITFFLAVDNELGFKDIQKIGAIETTDSHDTQIQFNMQIQATCLIAPE